ncbi:MAG TPA: hypothetical protein P5525_07540, partial [Candidatus Paceibacterota bacterium]|nr:hypothetical protein [Candidatus Paceibacterota bacterium]
MKTLILALCACCALVLPAHPQIPVTDAGVIAAQAVELARTIEMIANQFHQITLLGEQLTEAQFVSRVLGDPATIRTVSGLPTLLGDLQATGSNVARIALIAGTTALDAQQYTGGGLFRPVGEAFRTIDGDLIPRQDDTFKPYAAVIRAVANHDAVEQDVLARRQSLRAAIHQTLAALQAAATDAEAQKLHGVLLGQMADLEAIDRELGFAAQRAIIQDIENRNDTLRQEAAA